MARREIVALKEIEVLLQGKRIEVASVMLPDRDRDWCLEILVDDGSIVQVTAENGRMVARTNRPLMPVVDTIIPPQT